MLRRVVMLRRVLVRRIVAAPDVAAGEAQTQMDPPSVHLETFLAPFRCARGDVSDLVEVTAGGCHGRLRVGIPGSLAWMTRCARGPSWHGHRQPSTVNN